MIAFLYERNEAVPLGKSVLGKRNDDTRCMSVGSDQRSLESRGCRLACQRQRSQTSANSAAAAGRVATFPSAAGRVGSQRCNGLSARNDAVEIPIAARIVKGIRATEYSAKLIKPRFVERTAFPTDQNRIARAEHAAKLIVIAAGRKTRRNPVQAVNCCSIPVLRTAP